MSTGIMVVLLGCGILLITWSASVSESLSSDVSRLFTGSLTDKAVWLLIGGIVAAIIGLFGFFSWFNAN